MFHEKEKIRRPFLYSWNNEFFSPTFYEDGGSLFSAKDHKICLGWKSMIVIASLPRGQSYERYGLMGVINPFLRCCYITVDPATPAP
jgi:hypothetical protein